MPEPSHPYTEFEGSALWNALNSAIDELVENNDLEEQTARQYIVGYLAKALARTDIQGSSGNAAMGKVIDKYEESEARGSLVVAQRGNAALIEGPPDALRFVGELAIAWANPDGDDCDWSMYPRGTTDDYWFRQRSPMGILFHRIPCLHGYESILDEQVEGDRSEHES